MGLREFFGFKKPVSPAEAPTQEFTPEQLAKLRSGGPDKETLKAPEGPVGMQHFGYRHPDGQDNFYLRREADRKRTEDQLRETRDKIQGA